MKFTRTRSFIAAALLILVATGANACLMGWSGVGSIRGAAVAQRYHQYGRTAKFFQRGVKSNRAAGAKHSRFSQRITVQPSRVLVTA